MNSSVRQDSFSDAFTKTFFTVIICLAINSVNGALVFTYFKTPTFQQDPRYVLYIHLVINDMIMLTMSVVLQMLTYTVKLSVTACCFMLFLLATNSKISPLNLAGMAVERYIAVCWPLDHVQICTVHRVYALIALIWAVSCIPSVCDIIIFVTQPRSEFSTKLICYISTMYNTPYHNTQRIVIQVLLFFFVSLTVIVTYLKVVFSAQAASSSEQALSRIAQRTILLHGVQLLICMMSFTAPILNLTLIRKWSLHRTTITFSTFMLTNVLPRLLSSLIYGLRDKTFNRHIRTHLHCRHYCPRVKSRKPIRKVSAKNMSL